MLLNAYLSVQETHVSPTLNLLCHQVFTHRLHAPQRLGVCQTPAHVKNNPTARHSHEMADRKSTMRAAGLSSSAAVGPWQRHDSHSVKGTTRVRGYPALVVRTQSWWAMGIGGGSRCGRWAVRHAEIKVVSPVRPRSPLWDTRKVSTLCEKSRH